MVGKHLIMLVGPCGSGKSTMARQFFGEGYVYVNQDSQGKEHLSIFDDAVLADKSVVVDRMNFTKGQRARYLDIAKKHGFVTTILVLHESYKTCMERMVKRTGHETIKDETAARSALTMFFSKYERVQDDEADSVQRIWPEGDKPSAVVCDLDGTLCNCEHRQHFVRREKGQRKDWLGFFKGMADDSENSWCGAILHRFRDFKIVLCSGRPDDYRRTTVEWLANHVVEYDGLFMRLRNDSRQDDIVKEIILDFEILTRYTPYFFIDDRQQVVRMWRRRGYTCLQCAEGLF
jgi:predicted kinase